MLQDAVVARQYISDQRAFEQQARSWTGSSISDKLGAAVRWAFTPCIHFTFYWSLVGQIALESNASMNNACQCRRVVGGLVPRQFMLMREVLTLHSS